MVKCETAPVNVVFGRVEVHFTSVSLTVVAPGRRLTPLLLLLLQRVLLQPGQLGAGLLPAEEDGPGGLPAHLPHRQFPQGAGPHH